MKLLSLCLSGSLAITGGDLFGQVFIQAFSGCPMAHCDGRMSDQVNLVPPAGPLVGLLYEDTVPAGSLPALGCASNGSVAACSFTETDPGDPNLVTYNCQIDGPPSCQMLWSTTVLDLNAFITAPIVGDAGDLIVADGQTVRRFNRSLSDPNIWEEAWSKPLTGGIPISPVVSFNGWVVVATKADGTTLGGPIYTFKAENGAFGQKFEVLNPLEVTSFETLNTPGISLNRFYVIMQLHQFPRVGRLVAIDVDSAGQMTEAWRFSDNFQGPSGGSPLVIPKSPVGPVNDRIYFDGDPDPDDPIQLPRVLAVEDSGADPNFLWRTPFPSQIKASVAQDPRNVPVGVGSIWAFAAGDAEVKRLNADSGAEIQKFDLNEKLDTLIGGPLGVPGVQGPGSVMTIALPVAGDPDPIMIVGATTVFQLGIDRTSWVTAVELDAITPTMIWAHKLGDHSTRTGGQFPIIGDFNGNPVVVFSSVSSGAHFVANQ
ncbi:MAG: hypothetical protein ACE5JX_03950 [Acidobacteriota bacterium]